MRHLCFGILAATIASLAVLSSASARDLQESTVFTPPKSNKPLLVPFPKAAADHLVEGYLVVQMTVEADGSVADVEIVEGMNIDSFADAALPVLRAHHFVPASYNGKPVRAENHTMIMTFAMQMPDALVGASPAYYGKVYKAARRLYKKQKYAEAHKLLIETPSSATQLLFDYAFNLYFLAVLDEKMGDDKAALIRLRAATMRNEILLDRKTLKRALEKRFYIEDQFGLRYDALITAYDMRQIFGDAMDPAILKRATNIFHEMEEGAPIVAQLKVPNIESQLISAGTDGFALAYPAKKSRLKLRETTGQINSVNINCTARRYELSIEEGTTWELPGDIGHCVFILKGEPGASAEVVQWPQFAESRWAENESTGTVRCLPPPPWLED